MINLFYKNPVVDVIQIEDPLLYLD